MVSYWERQVQSRLSRRRVLQAAGLGGVALASASLLACGDDSSGGGSADSSRPFNTGEVLDSETGDQLRERFNPNHLKDIPAQKDPKYGGIHKINHNPPPSWDWTSAAASSIGFYGYTNNGLLGLWCDDRAKDLLSATMEPMLVKTWERPGPTTVLLHIEPNAKWHNVPPVNGRQFTSEDAAYVLEAYRKAPVQQFIMRDVDKIETPDKLTVKVSLKQPAVYFEQQLTTPYAMMFAREHAESADGLAKRPIGTSAYVWQSQQDRVDLKMVKNPEFWRKDPYNGRQLPYLDGITGYYFADATSSSAAFHSQQLDGIGGQDREFWQGLLRGHPEYVSTITPPPPANHPNMALRLDKAPWNDVRVRRALSLAIDRTTIAAGFGGLGMPAYAQDWSYMGEKGPWTLDQLGQYQKFDPQQAKQLLSAAGFANGFGRKITMNLGTGSTGSSFDIPSLSADSWRRNLGFEVELKPSPDAATFNKLFFGKTFDDIQANAYYTLGFEPDELSYGTNHSKAPSNFGFVDDRIMDDLVVRQGNELDKKERVKLLRQIMDRDLDQQFHIWTVVLNQITVRQPYVFNYVSFLYGGPTSVSSHNSQLRWLSKT